MKSLLILISLLLVGMVVSSPVYASPTTTLSMDPRSIIDTSMVAGTDVTINIKMNDVIDLLIFDFRLNYSAAVLTATQITLGDFFPENSKVWREEIDDTVGSVRYFVSMPLGTPKGGGINGSGTLATINFTVDSSGESLLDLCNIKLSDSYANPILYDVYDGYFSNIPGRPKLYVYPDAEGIIDPDLIPSENLTINVNVLNATDLYGSEFTLGYNTALLDAINASEGDFLKSFGYTNFTQNINETVGVVWVNVTLLGPTAGAVGNGTLATVTFNVTAIGECVLDLYNTRLVDSKATTIGHDTEGGYFKNKPVIHDVAITNVATVVSTVEVVDNQTFPVAKPIDRMHAGENVSVTVYVKNNGTVTETFNVTAYYNNDTIGTKSVTDLLEDASRTLTFEWSTEGVDVGNYTIWAEASVVAGETNTVNNRFTMKGEFMVWASGFPTEVAVAAIVSIIAAAAISVYFIKIRKPKPA